MERKFTAKMNDEEIIYCVFSEWIDDVVIKVLSMKDAFLYNSYLCNMIVNACEHKLSYEERRKEYILRGDCNTVLCDLEKERWDHYKTVIYDLIVKNL